MSAAPTHTTSPRVVARRAAQREQIVDAAWRLARRAGLTGFSMRELAAEVGMRAPSLYEYVAGKEQIYDAMFAQGNRTLLASSAQLRSATEVGTRAMMVAAAEGYLRFASEDPTRFQLLFQHAITGWEPSPEAYAPAVAAYEVLRERFTEAGVTDEADLDLWTGLLSGLAHQQLANDPGGDRWSRLAERAVDMYLAHLAAAGVQLVAQDVT